MLLVRPGGDDPFPRTGCALVRAASITALRAEPGQVRTSRSGKRNG
jgi:hypothetical protein